MATPDRERLREAAELWYENGLTVEFLEGMTYNHRVALFAGAAALAEAPEILWCEPHRAAIDPMTTVELSMCWRWIVGDECDITKKFLVPSQPEEKT